MKGKRPTTEGKIRIRREVAGGRSIREVCQERNLSEATPHRWRKRFGLTEMSAGRRRDDPLRRAGQPVAERPRGKLPRAVPGRMSQPRAAAHADGGPGGSSRTAAANTTGDAPAAGGVACARDVPRTETVPPRLRSGSALPPPGRDRPTHRKRPQSAPGTLISPGAVWAGRSTGKWQIAGRRAQLRFLQGSVSQARRAGRR
jgi:hypothetical protein